MAKVKNISGEARTFEGRLVLPGATLDVPEGWEPEQFTDQAEVWAAVKSSKTDTPTEG